MKAIRAALDRATELSFEIVAAQAARRDMTPNEAAEMLRALRRAALEDYQPGEDDDLDDEAAHTEPVGGDPERMRPAPTDLSATADATYAALEARHPDKRPDLIPAVPIEKSRTPEGVYCLHCGLRTTALKRHLHQAHPEFGYRRPKQQLRDPATGRKLPGQYDSDVPDTVADVYRSNWGLPADYSLTTDDLKSRKSGIAKTLNLGHIGRGHLRGAATSAAPEAAQGDAPGDTTRPEASTPQGKTPRRRKVR